jgi:hypothetical protein
MGIFDWRRKDKDGYKIRSSRLSNLQMMEYGKEAEKIVQEFGGLIATVMPQVKTKYPAMVFPSSMLPASKADIKEAYDMFLEPGSFEFSDEERNSLETTYMMLDRFIDDEDAKAKNEKYQAVRKKAK